MDYLIAVDVDAFDTKAGVIPLSLGCMVLFCCMSAVLWIATKKSFGQGSFPLNTMRPEFAVGRVTLTEKGAL